MDDRDRQAGESHLVASGVEDINLHPNTGRAEISAREFERSTKPCRIYPRCLVRPRFGNLDTISEDNRRDCGRTNSAKKGRDLAWPGFSVTWAAARTFECSRTLLRFVGGSESCLLQKPPPGVPIVRDALSYFT